MHPNWSKVVENAEIAPSRRYLEARKRRKCGVVITSYAGVMVPKVIDCDVSRRITQQLAVTCENTVHNGHISTCSSIKERGHRGSKNRDSHRRMHPRLIIQTKTVDRCADRGSGTYMLQDNAMGVIATASNGHTTTTFGRPRCPSRAHARTRGEADRHETRMSTSQYEPEAPPKWQGGVRNSCSRGQLNDSGHTSRARPADTEFCPACSCRPHQACGLTQPKFTCWSIAR